MNRTSGEPSHWELTHSPEFGDFNDGSARDHDLTASGSSTCSSPVAVTGGEIYWNGVWKSREEAIRLRDEFARPLPAGDWFAAISKQRAAELTEALRLTERVDA